MSSVPPIARIIAVARYDYAARKADELSFKKGTQFIVLEKHSSGWFVVERRDNKKQGLAPGNYFKVVKVDKVGSPRPSAKQASPRKTAPSARKAVPTSPRKEAAQESPREVQSPRVELDPDEEEDDTPPPPLPGPPPAWSDTIAGKAALEIAQKLAKDPNAAKKSPRSPRPVQDLFQEPELNMRMSGVKEKCQTCGEMNKQGYKCCEACGRPAAK